MGRQVPWALRETSQGHGDLPRTLLPLEGNEPILLSPTATISNCSVDIRVRMEGPGPEGTEGGERLPLRDARNAPISTKLV